MASCPHCHRTWHGLNECHCTICHRQFTSPTGFDRHGVNRHGCPDPATLRDKAGNPLLRLEHRAGGPIWTKWVSDENLTAMRDRLRRARDSDAAFRSRHQPTNTPPPMPAHG